MRAKEFISETSGSTVSGGIAVVAQPMGTVITRTQNRAPAKYSIRTNKGFKQKNVSRRS